MDCKMIGFLIPIKFVISPGVSSLWSLPDPVCWASEVKHSPLMTTRGAHFFSGSFGICKNLRISGSGWSGKRKITDIFRFLQIVYLCQLHFKTYLFNIGKRPLTLGSRSKLRGREVASSASVVSKIQSWRDRYSDLPFPLNLLTSSVVFVFWRLCKLPCLAKMANIWQFCKNYCGFSVLAILKVDIDSEHSVRKVFLIFYGLTTLLYGEHSLHGWEQGPFLPKDFMKGGSTCFKSLQLVGRQ